MKKGFFAKSALVISALTVSAAQAALVTDPNDARSWQGASVGTFATLYYGSNTLANRQLVVDNKLLDDSIFDATGYVASTLVKSIGQYSGQPGNILYRAAALVGGLAVGNFVLVNGTLLAGSAMSSSDDGDGLLIVLVPIALGIALIAAGYRAFRYGEEVEEIQKGARKATLAGESNGGLMSAL